MTSQNNFFEIMGYHVTLLQRILKDALIPAIALNCSFRWRYEGSKFDSIPYKPFKICYRSVSLEPTQN